MVLGRQCKNCRWDVERDAEVVRLEGIRKKYELEVFVMLIAKELAAMLDGRQYRQEIFSNEEQEAKESGLVVVFGCSDDLVELRGAIDDEVGAYEGTTIFVSKNGKLLNEPDCINSECPYYKAAIDSAEKIHAEWHNGNPCWTFKTSIPHETFSIFEDEDKFCEGIVFSIEDAKDVLLSKKEMLTVMDNFSRVCGIKG